MRIDSRWGGDSCCSIKFPYLISKDEEARDEVFTTTTASVDLFSEEKEREYVCLLLELVTALGEFHRKCALIMDTLIEELVTVSTEVM